MSVNVNTEKVTIELELKYSSKEAERILKQIKAFQRQSEQSTAKHHQRLQQMKEVNDLKLKLMDERNLKQQEIRQKNAHAKMLNSQKSWSSKMLSSMNSIKAGLLGMFGAITVGAVVQGMKNLSINALSLVADLRTLADALGVSTTFLAGLRGASAESGVNFDRLANSFTALAGKLQEARDGSEKAQEAFAKLGINWKTASIEEAVNLILEAGKNTDNLGRITELVGAKVASSYAKIATGVGNVSDAVKKYGTDIDEASKKADEFLDKIDAFKSQVSMKLAVALTQSGATDRIGQTLDNALAKIDITGLANAIEAVSKVAIGLVSNIGKLVSVIEVLASFRIASALGVQLNLINNLYIAIKRFIIELSGVNKAGRTMATIKLASDRVKVLATSFSKLSTILQAFAPVMRSLTKWSAWLSAFLLAWDFTYAKSNGLGFFNSVSYAVERFVDNVTFGIFKLDLFKKKFESLKWQQDQSAQATSLDKRYRDLFERTNEPQGTSLPKDDKSTLSVLKGNLAIAGKRVSDLYKSVQGKNPSDIPVTMNEYRKALDAYEAILDRIDEVQARVVSSSVSGKEREKKDESKEPTFLEKMAEKLKAYREELILASEEQDYWNTLLYQTKITFEEWQALTDTQIGKLKNANPTGVPVRISLNTFPNAPILSNDDSDTSLAGLGISKVSSFQEKVSQFMFSWQQQIDTVYDGLYQAGNLIGSLMDLEGERIRRRREAREEELQGIQAELDALKAQGFQYTEFYKRKEELAKKEDSGSSKRLRRMWEFQKAINASEATMNAITSFTTNLKKYAWPLGAIFGGISLATGMAQVAMITRQKAPEYEMGGSIPGSPYRDGTTVLAQGGEYITNRMATKRNRRTLERINNGVNMDERSITLIVQGNMISDDRWVNDQLLPRIQKAMKSGYSYVK